MPGIRKRAKLKYSVMEHKKKAKRYFVEETGKATGGKPVAGVQDDTRRISAKCKHSKDETVTCDLSEMDFSTLRPSSFRGRGMRASHGTGRQQGISHKTDPFPGDAPISASRMRKYKRGHNMSMDGIKTKFHSAKLSKKEQAVTSAVRQAARTELLLSEHVGFLEADEGEETYEISQGDIAGVVDIASAQKSFELHLAQFGPYRMNYTRNGRHLLMGGRRGHVAALDWHTKKLMCELNVMETIHDVKWLHIETMFAVAQKQWTYIYDNQGIELHCLKAIDCALRLEFLPYHFLLVSASSKGYVSYLDVSVGQKVAGYTTGLGRLDVMCQNPRNAVIHLGHSGGTVTLWSPNVNEPLVKMLCHGSGTRSIAVDQTGQYMATSGVDRTIKIWDLRMFKQLQAYKVAAGAGHLAFSQRSLLAAGMGNVVEIYRDCCEKTIDSPYLSHRLREPVDNLQFCPYEDVLGVGHADGFSSLLVPGAGEANFDALEANPYMTKSQRRQAEVKMLLEKIQPDMITLDTSSLGQLDTKTLQQQLDEKKKLLYLKPQKVDFEPRNRKKGAGKTGRLERRKKGVREERKRDEVRDFVRKRQLRTEDSESEDNDNDDKDSSTDQKKPTSYDVFQRFQKSQT